jgi:curli biogenesis system outer membrane secretion channel CsgG
MFRIYLLFKLNLSIKLTMKKHLILLFLILPSIPSFSQTNAHSSLTKIKNECENVPRSKRIRLSVVKFKIYPNIGAPQELGENLASMLTDALTNINCFRVLETVSATNENSQNNPGASSNALQAQLIVTGEITEFNEGKKGMDIPGLSSSKTTAHIGMIIKLIDPQTNEIIFSQHIEVNGAESSSTSITRLPDFINLPSALQNTLQSNSSLLNLQKSNPALASACLKGIDKGVEFLGSKKDNLELSPSVN